MPPANIIKLLSNELRANAIIGIQTNASFWEEYNHFCTELIRANTDRDHADGVKTNRKVEVKYWTELKRNLRGDSFYPGTLFDGM